MVSLFRSEPGPGSYRIQFGPFKQHSCQSLSPLTYNGILTNVSEIYTLPPSISQYRPQCTSASLTGEEGEALRQREKSYCEDLDSFPGRAFLWLLYVFSRDIYFSPLQTDYIKPPLFSSQKAFDCPLDTWQAIREFSQRTGIGSRCTDPPKGWGCTSFRLEALFLCTHQTRNSELRRQEI